MNGDAKEPCCFVWVYFQKRSSKVFLPDFCPLRTLSSNCLSGLFWQIQDKLNSLVNYTMHRGVSGFTQEQNERLHSSFFCKRFAGLKPISSCSISPANSLNTLKFGFSLESATFQNLFQCLKRVFPQFYCLQLLSLKVPWIGLSSTFLSLYMG